MDYKPTEREIRARRELHQNMAKKKMIREKIDINSFTGTGSWRKKVRNGD